MDRRWKKTIDKIKNIVSHDTLLSYPDFIKRFDIHTDVSDYYLGAVIRQAVKLIAFYSCKLTGTQIRYTVM